MRSGEKPAGIVCPETDSPVLEESVSKSKTLGYSGDLQVDSPASNGSGSNGVCNRMACLTNTQKQFINRVSFDRKL